MQRFGACTADLYALAAWLRQCQIDTVVLESTGVYWMALFEVLEERGFDVKLVAGAKFGRATTTLVASQRVKTSMIVSWTHILDRCYCP